MTSTFWGYSRRSEGPYSGYTVADTWVPPNWMGSSRISEARLTAISDDGASEASSEIGDADMFDAAERHPPLPLELVHTILDFHDPRMPDLRHLRLVSHYFNGVATERMRAFAVMTEQGMQRRWDTTHRDAPGADRASKNNAYWLRPANTNKRCVPIHEVVIPLHHPDECARATYCMKRVYRTSAYMQARFGTLERALPKHIPVLKLQLTPSPLWERQGDDPNDFNPTYGIKPHSLHGDHAECRRPGPFALGKNLVIPGDNTHGEDWGRECGYVHIIGKDVETIEKLVLFDMPFFHGRVKVATTLAPFYKKVEEMVWVCTYGGYTPPAHLEGTAEQCSILGNCEGHEGEPDLGKIEQLLELIPEDGRLRKVTIVFKARHPTMPFDEGCVHNPGPWWSVGMFRLLGSSLARERFKDIDFEFVNAGCLRPYEGDGDDEELFDNTPHGRLDAILKADMQLQLVEDGVAEGSPALSARQSKVSFPTMEEWLATGTWRDVFAEKEVALWRRYIEAGLYGQSGEWWDPALSKKQRTFEEFQKDNRLPIDEKTGGVIEHDAKSLEDLLHMMEDMGVADPAAEVNRIQREQKYRWVKEERKEHPYQWPSKRARVLTRSDRRFSELNDSEAETPLLAREIHPNPSRESCVETGRAFSWGLGDLRDEKMGV